MLRALMLALLALIVGDSEGQGAADGAPIARFGTPQVTPPQTPVDIWAGSPVQPLLMAPNPPTPFSVPIPVVPIPVVPIPETTPTGPYTPTTTPGPNPPEVLCSSPPCPPEGKLSQLSLEPVSGPNNNQQLGTQTVTISGIFFPSDCSKACVFSTPCDTCEMEVTYNVYFGSTTAGCNFYDLNADACQCRAVSGEELLTECGWTGTLLKSKYRCKKIVCKVQPLYGQQPLKIFFRDKACKPAKEAEGDTCDVFPAIMTSDGHKQVDPRRKSGR